MSSFNTDPPFVGPLPYQVASQLCQAQAQLHTQQLLERQFPGLTDEQWSRIFSERRPLLWVDEPAGTVTVAEEALPRLITWAAMFEASLHDTIIQTAGEGRYLARQLAYYGRLASELVANDPMLTSPDSIASMRAVFLRLCVGNEVAERLSEPVKKPMADELRA